MGKSYGVAYLYFFGCVCGPQSDRILVLFEVRAVESFGSGQFGIAAIGIFVNYDVDNALRSPKAWV